MSLVQSVTHSVLQTFYLAQFSNEETGAPISVYINISQRLTIVSQLFNRLGPLVDSPLLTTWRHASVLEWKPVAILFRGYFGAFLPYQSIVLFSLFLGTVYMATNGSSEISLMGKKIDVITVLIETVEITADVASAVSAVALIVLGQPVMGSCTLVFLVIQVAARQGIFHEQSTQEKTKDPMNPPWFFRNNQVVKDVWARMSKTQRCFLLNRNYFWVVSHLGQVGRIITAPNAQSAIFYLAMGYIQLYAFYSYVDSLEENKSN